MHILKVSLSNIALVESTSSIIWKGHWSTVRATALVFVASAVDFAGFKVVSPVEVDRPLALLDWYKNEVLLHFANSYCWYLLVEHNCIKFNCGLHSSSYGGSTTDTTRPSSNWTSELVIFWQFEVVNTWASAGESMILILFWLDEN